MICTPTSIGVLDSRRAAVKVLGPPSPKAICPLSCLKTGGDVTKSKLLVAAAFHPVERPIGRPQQFLDGCAVRGIHRDSHARGDQRRLPIIHQFLANPLSGLLGFLFAGFGQNQGEFIAAIASRRINGPAAVAQGHTKALDRATPRQVAVFVIDLFQTIQIEKENCETATGAPRTLNFVLEHFEQTPMVRKSGERIRCSKAAYLIEKLSVIEKW